jgi:hypothetical protein
MLKLALNWFLGGGFSALTDIYNKYKDSKNESERIQADWAKAQLDAMSANRQATSGFLEMRILTFMIALPFVVHVNLVGLDTCFKLGWKINAFPAPFDTWEGSILLSFFGLTAGVIGLKAIAGALRR